MRGPVGMAARFRAPIWVPAEPLRCRGPFSRFSTSRRLGPNACRSPRKDAPMDPIFGLFVQLHWIVNYGVMIGLLVASIWVWAIVIDKFMLFGRTRKSMDRFEQA